MPEYQFERLKIIGRGANSTVYEVRYHPTGELFALKVISGHQEDKVFRQIYREIDILQQVDHVNIIKCHGMFHGQAGKIEILFEFMNNGSLKGKHIINESSLADITSQLLSGLCYLHQRKIDHIDIKPSNLLINFQKQAKIADFGVSRILAQNQTMNVCTSSVGAFGYMSPERIDIELNHDGEYDGSAGDIWSLGMSVLEVYLGRYPFTEGTGGNWGRLMDAICKSPLPEAPTASPEFQDFIACCLQRDLAKRWTADQLLLHPFILKNTGDNQVTHQPRPPAPPHPHSSSSS